MSTNFREGEGDTSFHRLTTAKQDAVLAWKVLERLGVRSLTGPNIGSMTDYGNNNATAAVKEVDSSTIPEALIEEYAEELFQEGFGEHVTEGEVFATNESPEIEEDDAAAELYQAADLLKDASEKLLEE